MVDALALAKSAVALFRKIHPEQASLDQECQRYTGYYTQWSYQGNENGIRTYGSAKLAALDSPGMHRGGNINDAPVGAIIYWSKSSYWHNGNVLGHDNGRAVVAYATRGGDTILELGLGVKVSHADTYSQSTYYGWSYQNGTNPRMANITPWTMSPARPLDEVKRVAAYLNGRNLGRTTSSVLDGIPGANMYWLIQTAGKIDGIYTGVAPDGISGPKTEAAFDIYVQRTAPKPPTGGTAGGGTQILADDQRQVLSNGSANKRSTPEVLPTNKVGSADAGAVVTMTGWRTGSTESGNNVWFTDGTSWMWSGGFTDKGTHNLPEKPVATPEPPPGPKLTLDGIDISAWQEGINLDVVPGDFVIMKVTEGIDYVSGDFVRQYAQAKAAGKLLGIYHFASGPGTAKQQADWFVDHVGGRVGEAILFLDWEAKAVDLGATWALEFLDYVMLRTGSRPMIYMSQSVAERPEWDSVVAAGYKLWVAVYGANTPSGYIVPTKRSTGRWPSAVIHQYTSKGRLPGYAKDLDLNIFFGDKAAWESYTVVKPKPVPDPVPTPDPTPDPVPPSDDTPNWFVRFITIIIEALAKFLGGTPKK